MSIDPAASSTAGAAVSLRQGMAQMAFGVKALNQTAQQQQDVVTTLLGGGSGGAQGGNVTETRGQNLNIVV